MWCCRRPAGLSAQVSRQIQAKLREIETVFPRTVVSCIVTQTGELIAQQVKPDQERVDDLVLPIAQLKRAAEQFGSTLNQSSCPVVHLRGNRVMFSCYELGDHLLAFYTDMSGVDLMTYDTADADSRMGFIIADLRLLFQNLSI
ncbi:Roadblock/LAMTOR2 domain-containing protein [Plasmodiophora brassicae]|uniref:Roadblock/LAMTOR2 domain-containing protein n=1 Tax=Plasmodiophora brassicae TaxID=37360 RepID=A0A0G4IJA9_PLABS|nr:hypothetical protein PBRA_004020 [Plasmodiophora brassicae]SPQ96295.1 unnamed protein product [Plasmodiophora brassicae]